MVGATCIRWLAVLERVLPRLASVSIMFVYAMFADSRGMALYTGLLLGASLVQSTVESSGRQLAMKLVFDGGFQALAWRLRLVSSLVGLLGSIATVVVLAIGGETLGRSAVVGGSILILGILYGFGPFWVAAIQGSGRWGVAVKIQSYVTVLTAVIGLPLIVRLRSPLVPIGCYVGSEVAYYLALGLVVKRVGGLPVQGSDGDQGGRKSVSMREFFDFSLYGLLSWAQSQLDRFLLLAWGGAALSAVINFGWNATRSVSDSAAIGGVNVVRARLFGSRASDEMTNSGGLPSETVNRAAAEVGRVSLNVAMISAAVAIGGSIILPHMLSADLSRAARLVPLMSLVSVPLSYLWCMAPFILLFNKTREAVLCRTVGVFLCVPVLFAYAHDPAAGVLASIGREWIVAVLIRRIVRVGYGSRLRFGLGIPVVVSLFGAGLGSLIGIHW